MSTAEPVVTPKADAPPSTVNDRARKAKQGAHLAVGERDRHSDRDPLDGADVRPAGHVVPSPSWTSGAAAGGRSSGTRSRARACSRSSNYESALFDSSTNLIDYFVNSLVITLPAVFIPIAVALLAAYAFAWIDFKGRDIAVRRACSRCRSCPSRSRSSRCCPPIVRHRDQRHVLAHLAVALDVRAAAGDLPAAQLHAASIPCDARRGGPRRRRGARADLLLGDAAAARHRRSRRSRSSSSSGCGTTCSSVCVHGLARQHVATDGARSPSWRVRVAATGTLLSAGAFISIVVPSDRLPGTAALLRARHAGRLGQGLTPGSAK